MTTSNVEITHQPATDDITREQTPGAVPVATPVDIFENDDELLVVADVPGVPNEGVHVRLDGNELSIEAAQVRPTYAEAYRPLLFQRLFRVPSTIDAGRITAELTEGVLHVHLPKAERAKPRRIEVQAR